MPSGRPAAEVLAERAARAGQLAAANGDAPNGHGPAAGADVTEGPSPDRPFTDDGAADAWAKGQDPSRFFGREDGLLALTLAGAIATMGPLACGTDNRVWRYRAGVWVPAPDAIRDRAVRLLGNRYRPSYAKAAGDVVAAFAPAIRAEPVEWCINVPNGLLDWRAGQLREHTPDVLSTVQLAVPWEPAATAPEFARWLLQVVPPDCVATVLELIGYLAYSGNPLHAAVMLVGGGRNGKGTLLRIIKAILGPANITSASLHDLVNTRFTTATLFGKTANIAGDIDGTYLESTATLKAVTGGDQIQAEHKGRDRFDFTPWCVPVFSANKIPASADTTAGYLSRWLVLPFPHSFAGREDRTVEAKLHAELPGILAAGLRQLPALLARGQFSLGDSAREARADFERHVDQVRYWLHECCELGDYPLVNRALLHQAYKRWFFRDSGGGKVQPLKAGEFYARLAAAGVMPGADDGVRGFRGIRVTDEAHMSTWDAGT
jgi:putative DNA primase/helicase